MPWEDYGELGLFGESRRFEEIQKSRGQNLDDAVLHLISAALTVQAKSTLVNEVRRLVPGARRFGFVHDACAARGSEADNGPRSEYYCEAAAGGILPAIGSPRARFLEGTAGQYWKHSSGTFGGCFWRRRYGRQKKRTRPGCSQY